MKRFSKSALLAHMITKIRRLEREHGFTDRNGWAQVEGKGEALNRYYGEYKALMVLVDQIESGEVR